MATTRTPHPNSNAAKAARYAAQLEHFKDEQYQRAECAVHIVLDSRTTHEVRMGMDRLVQADEVTKAHALFVESMHVQALHALGLYGLQSHELKATTAERRRVAAITAATQWECTAAGLEAGGRRWGADCAAVLRSTAEALRFAIANL